MATLFESNSLLSTGVKMVRSVFDFVKDSLGFTATSTLTIQQDPKYGTCNIEETQAFIVIDTGRWNQSILYPFKSDVEALKVANTFWSAWVVYDIEGHELGSGGYSFAQIISKLKGSNRFAKKLT